MSRRQQWNVPKSLLLQADQPQLSHPPVKSIASSHILVPLCSGMSMSLVAGEYQTGHSAPDAHHQCQPKVNNHVPPLELWKSSITQIFGLPLPPTQHSLHLSALTSHNCHLPWIAVYRSGQAQRLLWGKLVPLSQCLHGRGYSGPASMQDTSLHLHPGAMFHLGKTPLKTGLTELFLFHKCFKGHFIMHS